MTNYLFTFGENHGTDRNGWIKISAPTVLDARAAMWKLQGAKWAFCYREDELKSEYFPAGELAHFTFDPVLDVVPVLLSRVDGYKPLTDSYVVEGGF